jgi:hypothetical protein
MSVGYLCRHYFETELRGILEGRVEHRVAKAIAVLRINASSMKLLRDPNESEVGRLLQLRAKYCDGVEDVVPLKQQDPITVEKVVCRIVSYRLAQGLYGLPLIPLTWRSEAPEFPEGFQVLSDQTQRPRRPHARRIDDLGRHYES